MDRYHQFDRQDLVRALRDYEAASEASDDEKNRLLYDLPLHQIELEIQNRELRDAQAALEDVRDRYAELYDFAPVGYLSLDASGMIRNLNLTACRMLGKERAGLLDFPLRSLLAADSRGALLELLREAFQTDDSVVGEVELDGTEVRVVRLECRSHPETDGAETCLTILTDITAQKRIESGIQRERSILQQMIDSVDDPMLVIGADYSILRMNQAARDVARSSGLDRDACLSCYKLMYDGQRPCAGDTQPCPLKTVMQTRQQVTVVHQHRSKSGEMRVLEVTAKPLLDETGQILGVIELNRDATTYPGPTDAD